MIENFTFDTDASPENMNMIIKGINKHEEDISGLKTSVEEVGSAIGQLSNKSFIPRGDLSIVLGTKDLNQAKTEGGYLCVETEAIKYINKPPLIGWFTLLIYLGGTGAVFQEAIQHDGVRTSRHFDGVNWSAWEEVATLKLTPVLATALPNITIVSQNSYILGNVLYIDIVVKRTDDSQFLNNTQYSVVTLSSLNITQPKNIGFTRWTTGFAGYIGGEIGGLYYDERIYIRPTTSCNLIHFMDNFILD